MSGPPLEYSKIATCLSSHREGYEGVHMVSRVIVEASPQCSNMGLEHTTAWALSSAEIYQTTGHSYTRE
jgi:hypothetical protein